MAHFPHIRELVLTGGPCAGKTTALSRIEAVASRHGWKVLCVPEAATMFIHSGVDMAAVASDPAIRVRFQAALMAACSSLREHYRNMAAAVGGDTLIVYDRAEPDAAAYTTPEEWAGIMSAVGTSHAALRDSYDAVVHMVSAAVGAEEHYSCDNNTARTETVEEARVLDAATLRSWLAHPRLFVATNDGSFEDKMLVVERVVDRLLEDPMPVEIERKYVVADVDLAELRARFETVTLEVTQRYVNLGAGEEQRVRRVVNEAEGLVSCTYVSCVKTETADPLVRGEEERLVGVDEWVAAAGSPEVRKRRHVFIFEGQRFELDEFMEPDVGWLLELELTDPDQDVVFPDVFTVLREVTDDPSWRNAALAAR